MSSVPTDLHPHSGAAVRGAQEPALNSPSTPAAVPSARPAETAKTPIAGRNSPLWRNAREFASSRIALAALAVLMILAICAIAAPLITPQQPYDLTQLNILDSRQPPGTQWTDKPGWTYLLGTDGQGRDMFSAIIYGLRISLLVGLSSTLIALLIGGMLGLVAGYHGGRVDSFIMRLVDIQLSFPPILVALILLAMSGPGVGKIIIALSAVQWAYYARTTRGAALVERSKEYVEAAHLQGLSQMRILTKHLLPNCLPPVIVVAALQVGHAITLEATLSFLGLGLPITEPSLGLLISNGFEHMLAGHYWISMFPGVALLILVVSINLVADQLRDVLNPRLQGH